MTTPITRTCLPYPPGSIERIEAALAGRDHDAAIVTVLVDILEMTDDEIDAFRASPLWPWRQLRWPEPGSRPVDLAEP